MPSEVVETPADVRRQNSSFSTMLVETAGAHFTCTIQCSEEVVRVASGTLAGSSDQRPGSGPISTASHRALVRAAPRWHCMQLFSLLCR